MLQTTNKKTNEVFVVGEMVEGKIQLTNVETQEIKPVAESTFKRWYTKPVEVETEVATEETVVEEVVETVVETVVEETVQKTDFETSYNVDECNELTEDNTAEQMRAYIEDALSIQGMHEIGLTELVECKDNIVAYKFKGKTIAQIKGKRKVKVYFTGKFLSEEVFEQCSHTKPEYTHNAFVKLENVSDVDLVFVAIEESKKYLMAK